MVEAAHLDDPVLFLEHIGLYGLRGGKTGWGQNINQKVDTSSVHTSIEQGKRHSIGKASIVREGEDVTIVTWGAMVHIAAEAASNLSENGIDVEIVDLRTLLPFDAESCIASVQKTGRLVVLQEGQWHGGLGHTIQSRILESTFYQLETQPVVIGAIDTPVPFSPPLENHTIPSLEHVTNVIEKLMQ